MKQSVRLEWAMYGTLAACALGVVRGFDADVSLIQAAIATVFYVGSTILKEMEK